MGETYKALQVRVSAEIDAMLQMVAEHYGVSQSDAVRYLIMKRADEIKQERREASKASDPS